MKTENQSVHSVTTDQKVTKTSRYVAPSDFIFKIQSFSSLGWTTKEVESGLFESGGYKWRLCLSTSGSKKQDGDHISLYLSLANTDKLPPGWELLVTFNFVLFNQIENEYVSVQDGDEKVRRFHFLKTKLGYDKVLPMSTIIDPTNGYVVDDTFVFGAEIFVIKPNNATFESLDLSKTIDSPVFSWKVNNFKDSKTGGLYSPEFVIGGRKWKLYLYPKGNGEGAGKSLSLFLILMDRESLGESKLEAKFKLRIIDQVSKGKKEYEASRKFSSSMSNSGWGFRSLLSFEDLNDATKKYLVDNTLLVEVEFCMLKISDVAMGSAV